MRPLIKHRIFRPIDPLVMRVVDGTSLPSAIDVCETVFSSIKRTHGDAVTAGIPVGCLADGVASGTPLVTKAGGFDPEPTIVNCLERLSGNDE